MNTLPRSGDTQAFSTLELVVALALVALVLAIVVPRLSPRPLHLAADAQEFSANLGVARSLAQSRTTRYRVRVVSPAQYVVERGVLGGVVWTFSVTERTVNLRSNISFNGGDVGKTATFDSRGRVVGTDTTFTLVDGARGWTKQILVRATGMVETP